MNTRRANPRSSRSRNPRKHGFAGALMLCLSMLVATQALAAGVCDVPPALRATKPTVESEPVAINVRLFVIDFFEVNDVAQTFRVDVHAELTWRDQRLSEARLGRSLAGCPLAHEAIWNPEPRLINSQSVTLRLSSPITVDGDGNVRYAQRFTGVLTARLKLQEFPFDTQTLPIILAFAGGMEDVKIIVVDEPLTHDYGFSIAGWTVQINEPIVAPFQLTHDLIMPQYRLNLTVERERGFYLGKVLLPVILIVWMAWGAYWLDPGAQPPRFGLSTSSVLTLIAFMLALGMWLPRVEYLTRADRFMIGAMTLVFLTLAEVIVTSVLNDNHRELALRFNRVGRWLYPIAFILVGVFALFG